MADGSEFFLVLRGEGVSEAFLELRFRNGAQLCFPYDHMGWFSYSPDDGTIDFDFDGFLVTIKGRGLVPKLFDSIKARRVAWVREADTELQDSKDFECFIEAITVLEPLADDEAPGEA